MVVVDIDSLERELHFNNWDVGEEKTGGRNMGTDTAARMYLAQSTYDVPPLRGIIVSIPTLLYRDVNLSRGARTRGSWLHILCYALVPEAESYPEPRYSVLRTGAK